MPVLEISKTGDMGERCWGLTLTTDAGQAVRVAPQPRMGHRRCGTHHG